MGLFDFFRSKKSKPTLESSVLQKDLPPVLIEEERTESLIELAKILSDSDAALLHLLTLHQEGKGKEFGLAFKEGIEEFFYDEYDEDDLSCIEIETLVIRGLIYFGYIGNNDWKFNMEDFLFNSEQAFQHYGLQISLYDNLENKDQIFAPEALEQIAQRLPEEMGVAVWNEESDSYLVIISKKEIISQAIPIAHKVGIKITNWSLNQ